MSNVIRWDPLRSNPFRELEDLGSRFTRFFDRLSIGRGNGGETMTVADWVPAVDIAEDENEYLIKVEIPEVDKKDVKVTVQEGSMLTMQGERKKEQKDETSRRFHRMERVYGKFVRSFMLPEDADEDKIMAEFKDGMLMVHLPKRERPKPKQVEVKVA